MLNQEKHVLKCFSFNRYYSNEKINVQTFGLIESRVTKKYKDIKNCFNVNNLKTRKHYENFISNIKNKNLKNLPLMNLCQYNKKQSQDLRFF